MNREGLGKLNVILKSGTMLTFYSIEDDALQPNRINGIMSIGSGLNLSYRTNDVDFTIFDESDKRKRPPEINGDPIAAPYESEE